jgi:ring-1,2-phenylacetyl-CoA epoxidase subunit PaaD
MVMPQPQSTESLERVWQLVRAIADPEIPVISICDLGIVRGVRCSGDELTVVITPTYSGCPAMAAIESEIRAALGAEGLRNVKIETVLSPAWSTDWITEQGREALRAYGIAPPQKLAPASSTTRAVRFVPRAQPCPRCGSRDTAAISQFGSTACKALYRCLACGEPFDYFKAL